MKIKKPDTYLLDIKKEIKNIYSEDLGGKGDLQLVYNGNFETFGV